MGEGICVVTVVSSTCCWRLQSYESPLLEFAQKSLEAGDAQLGLERSGVWIGERLDVVDGEVMTIWLEAGTLTGAAAAAAILEDGH